MSYFDEEDEEIDEPIPKSYYDYERERLNELRARIVSHTLSDAEREAAKAAMAEIEAFLAYKEEHDLVKFKDKDLEMRD